MKQHTKKSIWRERGYKKLGVLTSNDGSSLVTTNELGQLMLVTNVVGQQE